jgi:monofunctional biosynthetic peptidoglycan transglycosylase
MADGIRDEEPQDPAPPLPAEPEPDLRMQVEDEAEDESQPVQIAAPETWPLYQPPAPREPLGERPLPDLEPLERPAPRRRPGPRPGFERPLTPSRQPPTAPRPPESRRKRKPLWRRILGWIVKLVLAFLLLSVTMVVVYRFVGPPITWTMIGDVIGGHGATKSWTPLSRIDPSMARAAIAAEDSRFCEHHGFDIKALEEAYARNQRGGRIRGGSTISQQTAKNVFLWQGGGYFRKGLEAYFTVLIENIWGKRRIMEVYLNVAETGIGTYGVNAGAMRYFKHDASRLSAREAAQIAAVLPLPKKRAAIDPRGFTRRYGNSITARIGVVRGDGLDACLG